jgi:hypothetical protein
MIEMLLSMQSLKTTICIKMVIGSISTNNTPIRSSTGMINLMLMRDPSESLMYKFERFREQNLTLSPRPNIIKIRDKRCLRNRISSNPTISMVLTILKKISMIDIHVQPNLHKLMLRKALSPPSKSTKQRWQSIKEWTWVS